MGAGVEVSARLGGCAVKGVLTQPVEVRPEELSVHLGSYPGGGEGDRLVEALGKDVRARRAASVWAAT